MYTGGRFRPGIVLPPQPDGSSMDEIPDSYLHVFDHPEAFAHLATIMPDGSPQVTPVWVDYDGEHVLVNTARGRRKVRNVERDSRVAVSILDPEDPYRYVTIRGTVTEVTEEGAIEHIDELARRYMDVEEYPNHGDESGPRVIFRIEPQQVYARE